MGLFQFAPFYSHSGKHLFGKIECDALSDDDWAGVSIMVRAYCNLPPFSITVGVPRGGLKLAEAMETYRDLSIYRRLICDDVLTTGASILALMDRSDDIGLVLFARGPMPPRVTALFTMPSQTGT